MGKDLKGLFLAHRRELNAYLTRAVRDPDTAADLTQEAYLRLAEQQGGAAILDGRAYLYRIARNLVIDHARRADRQCTEAASQDALALLPDDTPNQEETAAARQRLAVVQAAVDELPARTRAVLLLVRVEGLGYRETAERLGLSESAVQKHLSRALLHVMKRRRRS